MHRSATTLPCTSWLSMCWTRHAFFWGSMVAVWIPHCYKMLQVSTSYIRKGPWCAGSHDAMIHDRSTIHICSFWQPTAPVYLWILRLHAEVLLFLSPATEETSEQLTKTTADLFRVFSTLLQCYMSNFQNLRNRRYYISWLQVSRSVSKSSGTIGSTRKTRYLYRIYVYMWDA